MTKLEVDINKAKAKLISQAKQKGISETFGQKEVRDIEDKHNYLGLCYGSHEDRMQAELIRQFDDWCSNFDNSQIK